MKIKKLLVSLLITLTVLSSAVFAFGCGGTKGLVYELNDDESGYVVMGFLGEVEEYPEVLEIPAKYKGKTVKKIGASAFKNITEIKKVILKEGLEEINSASFRGCTNLEEVEFPTTLKYVGSNVFNGCKKLKSAIIPEGMDEVPAGYIYGCETITEITVPGTVKTIQAKAFGKTSIKKLVFPNSVEDIIRDAFAEATKLEEIDIGDSVKKIGSYVFANCTALKKITLSETLKTIEEYAFQNCSSLAEIVIPESVDLILARAFEGCSALRKMTLVGQTSEVCNRPECGASIAPESKRLGFTTHYHTNKFVSAEGWHGNANYHHHWIFSHDLADPNEAWKYFVTDEARSLHNHAMGGQGDYWSYDEDNDVYKFNGELIYSGHPTLGHYAGTNVDEDIRGWQWLDSRTLVFFNVHGDFI